MLSLYNRDLYKINNTLNKLTDKGKSKVLWEYQRTRTLLDNGIKKKFMKEVVL